jgi:gamma-glutamyltranspeptidase/glutathione hydrolase
MLATQHGELRAVFGSMGGDAQPQIVLQLAARLLLHGQSPATAVHAGRWALRGPVTGFDTWTGAEGPTVTVEGHTPRTWLDDLARRGHRVAAMPPFDGSFGHAHAIVVDGHGTFAGAADPRSRVGSVAGI